MVEVTIALTFELRNQLTFGLIRMSERQGPTARLRVLDGDNEPIEVPVTALRMLVRILANMAEGNAGAYSASGCTPPRPHGDPL